MAKTTIDESYENIFTFIARTLNMVNPDTNIEEDTLSSLAGCLERFSLFINTISEIRDTRRLTVDQVILLLHECQIFNDAVISMKVYINILIKELNLEVSDDAALLLILQ